MVPWSTSCPNIEIVLALFPLYSIIDIPVGEVQPAIASKFVGYVTKMREYGPTC